MITEYTDCTELMRLIEEQKIKPSAIKSYLRKQGIIFTASNAESFSKDCYTIALGGQEIEYVTRMICHEGNYEKSTLVNIHMKPSTNAYRIIDYFSDGINELRSCHNINYIIEQPVRINENTLAFCFIINYLGYNPVEKKIRDKKREILFKREDVNELQTVIKEIELKGDYRSFLIYLDNKRYKASLEMIDSIGEYYKAYVRTEIMKKLKSPAESTDLSKKVS